MGLLRLAVPDPVRLVAGAVETAYLTGMEAVPFPSRNAWDGHNLCLTRDVRESGSLHVLWEVPERGPLLLSTANLMEREQPYLMPVELARGTLNRLRNQQSIWESMGLSLPSGYEALERSALRHFTRAATQQGNPRVATDAADNSLREALAAIDLLSSAYVDQVLELRHEQTARLPTILGSALPTQTLSEPGTRVFTNTFNAATVNLCWRTIEPAEGEYDWTVPDRQFQWLKGKPLKVCGGPLLRLDDRSLPDWMYLWEDDFEAVQQYAQQFIEAAVNRYRGQVNIWHCAAGLNLPGGLPLVEEQKLRLAVLTIDAVRRIDTRSPVIVSFDRPWGEYLQHEELDLPPYHFADALVRADLGLSGVGFEINLGYTPGGTLPRDILELSRLVDRWSSLGVPLLAFLTSPSEAAASGKATTVCRHITPALQAAQLRAWLKMLTAKQSMHGILWNHFADSEPSRWPHSGLIDAAGAAKPIMASLAELRKQHLA